MTFFCHTLVKFHVSPRMHHWSAASVRTTFINHFVSKYGYKHVPSSSVKPSDENSSLLLVNAGMNQFKPIFSGSIDDSMSFANLQSAVNSQKCIRVGGKHNDLENVGRDSYHHTFFEMMGHWSFRNHWSKKEACRQALELLVNEFGLNMKNMIITYHGDNSSVSGNQAKDSSQPEVPIDEETRDIWLDLGFPESRVLPRTADDNFWEMGDVGPCGPCTEIHYASQPISSDDETPPSVLSIANAMEIWNLVFISYNRSPDGKLERLPTTHVDTGLGLERLVAILQGVSSNYCTDLFSPLMDIIHSQHPWLSKYRDLYGVEDADKIDRAYRILCDHARAYTVAICDGVLPEHSGRGHIIQSLINRSVYQLMSLGGANMDVLPRLCEGVADSLGQVYPSLRQNLAGCQDIVLARAKTSKRTIRKGRAIFRKWLDSMEQRNEPIDIADYCKLHFSHGMRPDLIVELAQMNDLNVDVDALMSHIKTEKAVPSLRKNSFQDDNVKCPEVIECANAEKISACKTGVTKVFQ